jgi:hypothetical protein
MNLIDTDYHCWGNKLMPSLLIIGADHLGPIEAKLAELGFDQIAHISGRKSLEVKRAIPDHVDYILVLTDYVNHNLSKVVKQRAKESSLPILFAKRSWSSIHQVLTSNQVAM